MKNSQICLKRTLIKGRAFIFNMLIVVKCMDYKWIECQLNKLANVYREIYDKVELEIGKPATKNEILRLENEIGMELPMQLK